MKKKITLRFKKPADDDVNKKGGQFGAFRHHGNGTHTGLDFLSYLDPVYASESGLVVYSGFREGSTKKPTMVTLSSLITPLKFLTMKNTYLRYTHTLTKETPTRGRRCEGVRQ